MCFWYVSCLFPEVLNFEASTIGRPKKTLELFELDRRWQSSSVRRVVKEQIDPSALMDPHYFGSQCGLSFVSGGFGSNMKYEYLAEKR